jgi:transposase
MICASLWLEVTMSDVFLLTKQQLNRIKPYFPVSHGVPRVDDVRVISGIIYVIRYGLQWKDAPKVYGPYKTLYNRFVRWSRAGIFNKIFRELSSQPGARDCLMIDATHLKAHRTAASLLEKGQYPAVLAARKVA